MSSTDWKTAWRTVEEGCREYLNGVLGTVEGVSCYSMTALPRQVPQDDPLFFMWAFGINGGPVVAFRQNRTEIVGGIWKMNAEFMAICSTDEVAMTVAGAVVDALPATASDVSGLAVRNGLHLVEYPERRRITMALGDAAGAGKEQVFIELTIRMGVAFQNV